MSILDADSPTAGPCPACLGRRTRLRRLPDGSERPETCSWCEGCGFVLPQRAREWAAYQQKLLQGDVTAPPGSRRF